LAYRLTGMPRMTDAYDWSDRTLLDRHGERIGKLDELFVDESTGEPEWATVHTGLLGTRLSFVPLAGAEPVGEEVRLEVDKAQVREAPSVEAGEALPQAEEERLYAHYGFEYSRRRSSTGLAGRRRG
jgi:PRC-barrel domain protein